MELSRSDPDTLTISVVIPTHNRADRVSGAVVSACKQTRPPLEVLVVDNGSTDDTPSVLFGLAQQHRLVRVIRQENLGEAGSRNTGLREARGDIVAFLDDDDAWMPEKLERQTRLFSLDPSLGMTFTSYRRVSATGADVVSVNTWSAEPAAVIRRLMLGCCIQTSTVVVRRSVLRDAGQFDGELLFSDWPMWLRIAGRGHRIGFLNEVLTEYAWHGENLSRSPVDVSETAMRMFAALFADPTLELGGRAVRRRCMARWRALHAFNLLEVGQAKRARRLLMRAAVTRVASVRPGWILAFARSWSR